MNLLFKVGLKPFNFIFAIYNLVLCTHNIVNQPFSIALASIVLYVRAGGNIVRFGESL